MIKRTPVVLALGFVICFSAIASSQESQTTTIAPNTNSRQVQYFYVHLLGTISFDIYKSSDINSLFTDDMKIHTIGFPFLYGIRGGFRNIAQLEYHLSSSSAHNIGTVTGYVNGEFVGVSVPMKLKTTNTIFKLNPFFWSWSKPVTSKPANAMFVIVGTGDVTYKDKIGEGFKGSGMIYGLEYATIARFGTFSIGMTIHHIKYTEARLFDTNFIADMKASRFMLYSSLGLGYGI